MDHRVKPGGDDERGRVAFVIAIDSEAIQLAGAKLDCFVAVALRSDEWFKSDKMPSMRGKNQ
jgi:hypothetical protein